MISSGVILAGAKYVLQKSFDYHLARLLEEKRLLAQETARRQASTYDAQVTAFNKINSLTNRLQVITRNFAEQLKSEDVEDEKAIREALREYKIHTQFLSETMLEEGMWLPPALFIVIRDLKSRTDELSREAEKFRRQESHTGDEHQNLTNRAITTSQKADELYETIREIIQAHIGVTDRT